MNELVADIESAGITSEDLDTLVHVTAFSLASIVNNGGVKKQIEFLVQQVGETEAVSLLEALKERLGK